MNIDYKKKIQILIISKEKLIEYYLYDLENKNGHVYEIVDLLENEVKLLKSKL